MLMLLLRSLAPETAHNLTLWALRTNIYRIALWLDAIVLRATAGLLFAYARPLLWIKARLSGVRCDPSPDQSGGA